MITSRYRAALVALLLAAVPACAGGEPEAEDGALATDTAGAMAPAPTTSTAPALTDPQIAHIAVTANTIDIESGRLAESRTTTQEVLSFAQTMITDHTAVNEQASALAQRLGVTPEDNDVSRSLQQSADSVHSRLEGLNGAAFDSAYIAHEVQFHQTVLDALDQTLIPGAQNAELRGLLEQVRPAIAAHLDRARSLQTTTAGGQ